MYEEICLTKTLSKNKVVLVHTQSIMPSKVIVLLAEGLLCIQLEQHMKMARVPNCTQRLSVNSSTYTLIVKYKVVGNLIANLYFHAKLLQIRWIII
jgi:hypothetical protein